MLQIGDSLKGSGVSVPLNVVATALVYDQASSFWFLGQNLLGVIRM
jgi:hypothetical protein